MARAFAGAVGNVFDNVAARRDLGFRPTIPSAAGVRGAVRALDAQGAIEAS